MQICRESPDVINVWQKFWTIFVKSWVCYIFAGDINSPQKHFGAALNICILLTGSCSWKKNVFLRFQCKIGYTDALQCYIILTTLPILFMLFHVEFPACISKAFNSWNLNYVFIVHCTGSECIVDAKSVTGCIICISRALCRILMSGHCMDKWYNTGNVRIT